MTVDLITDADLAERWGLSLEKFHDLRKRHHWPCVKLGRFEYRFTEDQVQQIVARQTIAVNKPVTPVAPKVPGRTSRSAARQRAR